MYIFKYLLRHLVFLVLRSLKLYLGTYIKALLKMIDTHQIVNYASNDSDATERGLQLHVDAS